MSFDWERRKAYSSTKNVASFRRRFSVVVLTTTCLFLWRMGRTHGGGSDSSSPFRGGGEFSFPSSAFSRHFSSSLSLSSERIGEQEDDDVLGQGSFAFLNDHDDDLDYCDPQGPQLRLAIPPMFDDELQQHALPSSSSWIDSLSGPRLFPAPSLSSSSSPSSLSSTATSGADTLHDAGRRFASRSATLDKRTTFPVLRSTGTTIAGAIVNDGRTVVLGADSRSTSGSVVADRQCSKVHRLAHNVWCCGAGTAGDLDALVREVRFTLLLQHDGAAAGNRPLHMAGSRDDNDDDDDDLSYLPTANVFAVCRMIQDKLYRSGGRLGVNLVLGGYDVRTQRAILVAIHPHGSMDVVPFAALGSGGLAAMAVLEARYSSSSSSSTTIKEGMEWVTHAIQSGITNDLGSGSQVDLCVLTCPTKDQAINDQQSVLYQRAVVPEEDLPVDRATEAYWQDNNNDSDSQEVAPPGVGGFGNVPYRVISKRVLKESKAVAQQKRQLWFHKNVLE